MNLISVTCENFCSYKYLSFDFDAKGLCLISGDTGVGKSTLLDAVAWGLFGITSKDGSADDVLAWDASDPTLVQVLVETPTGRLVIYRTRGQKNDLGWIEDDTSEPTRGKDLGDTQRLLEQRLGVTAELFLTGAYLTQFSKADSFFIAKAKDRRQVLEKIADQEFAIKLADRTSAARKVAKKDTERLELELSGITGRLEVTKERIQDEVVSETQWVFENTKKIKELDDKRIVFEVEKRHAVIAAKAASDTWEKERYLQLSALRGHVKADSFDKEIKEIEAESTIICVECPTCGAPRNHKAATERTKRLSELKALKTRATQDTQAHEHLSSQVNPYAFHLDRSMALQNSYAAQLKALEGETNPCTKRLSDANAALQTLKTKRDTLQATLTETNALVASLTWLYDKSFEMRSLLMARVVSQIETATNTLLEKHFDAAIRVRFLLEDSDKLEVEVLNDGHQCGFKSLSGGERTMLKLCFSLSLMKAAQDKAGIHFDQIFLDEPLSGLDTGLKVKAFGLFQQLESEHSTVLIIEHDEAFKSQFSNTYVVSKGSDGHSEIHESKS